jgi:hypothetical protein
LRNESNCSGKVKFADVTSTSFKNRKIKDLKLNICFSAFSCKKKIHDLSDIFSWLQFVWIYTPHDFLIQNPSNSEKRKRQKMEKIESWSWGKTISHLAHRFFITAFVFLMIRSKNFIKHLNAKISVIQRY